MDYEKTFLTVAEASGGVMIAARPEHAAELKALYR
jgi:hypothetical protein